MQPLNINELNAHLQTIIKTSEIQKSRKTTTNRFEQHTALIKNGPQQENRPNIK